MKLFLQNNNHQAAIKMKKKSAWGLFCKKLYETQGSQFKFHGIKYIYLIYIYLLLLLLLLYYSSILDIEYSPYYIALGSTHTNKLI